jgi:hypothetical protein
MATKFPSIPGAKTPFEEAVKECLEILLGIRGLRNTVNQALDRAILYREAFNLITVNSTITSLTASGGFAAPSEKTIASGEITVIGTNYFRHHTVDTEGDAASDDLTTINGGNPGELLIIRAESGSRDVVCKDGASLIMGSDFTFNNIADSMLLLCVSAGVWYPLTKYNGGS